MTQASEEWRTLSTMLTKAEADKTKLLASAPSVAAERHGTKAAQGLIGHHEKLHHLAILSA